MKTFWNDDDRQQILARLDRLDEQSQARWGKFDVQGMLAHLADALRMPLGQIEVAPRKLPLRYPPLKQLLIYALPFPKGAPTAPELIRQDPSPIEVESAAIVDLAGQLGARKGSGSWPEHPAFGRLSNKAWGVLIHKHMDHHLKQFGV